MDIDPPTSPLASIEVLFNQLNASSTASPDNFERRKLQYEIISQVIDAVGIQDGVPELWRDFQAARGPLRSIRSQEVNLAKIQAVITMTNALLYSSPNQFIQEYFEKSPRARRGCAASSLTGQCSVDKILTSMRKCTGEKKGTGHRLMNQAVVTHAADIIEKEMSKVLQNKALCMPAPDKITIDDINSTAISNVREVIDRRLPLTTSFFSNVISAPNQAEMRNNDGEMGERRKAQLPTVSPAGELRRQDTAERLVVHHDDHLLHSSCS